MRPYFRDVIKRIADNPGYLEKINIIGADFVTRDHMKVNAILGLNLDKNFIKEECIDGFRALIAND